MVQASEDLLIGHYEGIGKLGTRRGQPILDMVVSMMQTTPVLAMVWEGVEVVAYVRKIVGSTEPKSAAPGTIRGDYAHMSYGYLDANPGTDLFNLVHASADVSEAEQEIPHWFDAQELFPSKALHTVYTK